MNTILDRVVPDGDLQHCYFYAIYNLLTGHMLNKDKRKTHKKDRKTHKIDKKSSVY